MIWHYIYNIVNFPVILSFIKFIIDFLLVYSRTGEDQHSGPGSSDDPACTNRTVNSLIHLVMHVSIPLFIRTFIHLRYRTIVLHNLYGKFKNIGTACIYSFIHSYVHSFIWLSFLYKPCGKWIFSIIHLLIYSLVILLSIHILFTYSFLYSFIYISIYSSIH